MGKTAHTKEPYEVTLEVAGPLAMFARPDTGGTPTSYPVPTWSAAKGLFDRRLKQGRCFRTPCLGWSEFTCSYWGPFRSGVTEVDEALDLEVPSMLLGVWDDPTRGRYAPTFRQDVKIVRGLLHYDHPD